MVKRKVEDIVEEICQPIIDNLKLQFIDVEYKKEGSSYILRIIIDKPEGVDIDDCENVSRLLDEKLDELDPIENGYTLEVQSPGERNLKRDREFEYFKEREVEIKLYEAQEGRKTFEGKLMGLNDGAVKILLENGEEMDFTRTKIASVKLKINF